MAEWVLIFWYSGMYGASPATAEFNTRAACVAALAELRRTRLRFEGFCTMKGEQPLNGAAKP